MFPFQQFGLNVRLVDVTDAEFITNLRINVGLSRYLSSVDNDVEKQKEWIQSYKKRESQNLEYYLLYTDKEDNRLGLNRLYNLNLDEFELGSWIFKPSTDFKSAILADIIAKDFGFNVLKLANCKFEVRKENKSVVKYHAQFKPTQTGEDLLNYYYQLNSESYFIQRNKLLKLLGYGIK